MKLSKKDIALESARLYGYQNNGQDFCRLLVEQSHFGTANLWKAWGQGVRKRLAEQGGMHSS